MRPLLIALPPQNPCSLLLCSQLKKVKKANGEIIGVNVVCIHDVLSLAAVQVAGGMGTNHYHITFDPFLRRWMCFFLDLLDSREEAFESQELRYLDPI